MKWQSQVGNLPSLTSSSLCRATNLVTYLTPGRRLEVAPWLHIVKTLDPGAWILSWTPLASFGDLQPALRNLTNSYFHDLIWSACLPTSEKKALCQVYDISSKHYSTLHFHHRLLASTRLVDPGIQCFCHHFPLTVVMHVRMTPAPHLVTFDVLLFFQLPWRSLFSFSVLETLFVFHMRFTALFIRSLVSSDSRSDRINYSKELTIWRLAGSSFASPPSGYASCNALPRQSFWASSPTFWPFFQIIRCLLRDGSEQLRAFLVPRRCTPWLAPSSQFA